MIDDKLSFTGERFIPSEQGEIRIEHLQRYIFTLDLVTKKRVLDLACGEGYGSFLISGAAKQVIGVDVSDVAVRHATTKYAKKHGNLKFQKCSATNLPFQDGSFDVVVSFETIEHLAEQMQMVAEIRRVLSPQG
jgi:ubiquinone/menaquinone biosynthesis C-methylase UbiE